VLLFLAAALSWFGWRRIREARVELARRVALEKRLADTLTENRRWSLSHVHVQEDERKQLARELHDELGQHLNAIKIDAVSIRDWSSSDKDGIKGDINGDIHAAAMSIVDVADHVQNTIRDMLRRLRPAGLDELGLAAALENLVQQWQARNPATRAVLEADAAVDGLNENENITCYRLVQEALTNVTRHAGAHHVTLRLQRLRDQLVMEVRDDGTGAPAASLATTPGLGLVGMRERVEALGGNFAIESAAGGGFRIKAVIPVMPVAPVVPEVAA
jgi:two-component system, NarL family, sensor histidine kinase UhpB